MAAFRKRVSANALILIAIGISAAAVSVLVVFPEDPLVWQIASWVLVAALIGLLALVLASGFVLATNRATRTWRRIVPFLIGTACLAAIAVGSL